MSTRELQPLFDPRGIVVVGASGTPEKLGHAMASSLASFPGSVQLVNSRPSPGMFTSIADAVSASADVVDLAVLCVPAAITARALSESAEAGVSAALVCAGGFAEAGGSGLDYAADVGRVVRETGMRLLGPNTSGFFVPETSLFASFVPGARDFRAGKVAVVAASGGVNHVLAFHLDEQGAGVSIGVGIGAAQDVSAADVLRYLVTHEPTRSVILHVENVPDGRDLIDAVERLSAVKPVVALVVGRNDVSEFAQSHTGALATSWRTTRAVLRQAGAVLVDDEDQAVAAAIALAGRRAVPSTDAGAGLITGQAGPGLIVVDSLATAGVAVPRLTAATHSVVSELLPPITFQWNPVDTGRPGDSFPAIVRAVAEDPGIDVLGIYAITEPVVDLPSAVSTGAANLGIPILLGVDGPSADVSATRSAAAVLGLPVLRGPTRLAHGVAALVEDARRQAERSSASREPVRVAPFDSSGDWDEIRGKDLLDELGVRTPARRRCEDRAAAHEALAALGAPVAVKLVDAAVLHKTDIGGVVLGVATDEQMSAALDVLDRAGAAVYLVEKMAPPGADIVIGAHLDGVFGPVVVVGLGGIATEVLGDVAIRSAPISADSAAGMIDDLAGKQLVTGFRGGPAFDLAELGRITAALGDLVASGTIDQIEINPLRATIDGIIALDAVVVPAAHVEELAR